MKKYILAALAAALLCIPTFAQNPTAVTGTLTDPSSVAYYPAQVTACLTPVTIDPTVGGKHVNPNIGANYCVGPVQTAPSGAFSMALYANGNITPGATQWIFTVQTAGSGPPAGKGAQTFSSAAVTVSGTSQDVSTNLNSIGPAQLNSGAGGVVGGTFGAGPSSGYTFTSTPITTSPFSGNVLIGANMNNAATGSYTAGSGYTLIGTSIVLGMEYQIAGSATSYSSPFTYSVLSTNWGGTIAAFSSPGNNAAFVQGKVNATTVTSLAYTSNNGAGNLLVAVFRYNGGAPMVSVTDTRGNTWVSAGMRCFEGYTKGQSPENNSIEVWYTMNSIAGANTVTGNMGAGTTGSTTFMGIAEFSGMALTNALVDYNFTGSTTSVTNIPGATTNPQYTINAVNNVTGVPQFTGRDSGAVFRSAANQIANTPALLYFKNGIYPGQTSVQENTGGQTNWYIWGTPSPAGGNEGSWHIECETFTQILYTSLQTNGCIHQIMPSAYAGPQPTSNTLSGFWQRPANGGTYAPAIFFVNGTVRIPDNQHTPSNSYDTFMAVYSSHIGTVADTVIIAADQACSGLAAGQVNVNGYRSNQSQTDETYFENTWAIGFNNPYNSLSNHPFGNNMHAVCNVRAGTFNSISTVYGGMLIHFQDTHNAAGLQFGCGIAGMRWDSLNMVVENLTSGVFGRTSNASETTPGNCTGTITVNTQAAGGSYAVPAFFDVGSGANFSVSEGARTYQQGLINPIAPPAATTGTVKQTLATFTFQFNSTFTAAQGGIFLNNPGAVVDIFAWGTTAANANSKTVQFDFGGTTIATITSTANNGTIRCRAHIRVGSVANTQTIEGECIDGTVTTPLGTSPGINGSANIVLNLAATTPTAAGDFTFKDWTIEYLGGR